MKGDGRSLRVALVGDGILNAASGSPGDRVLDGLVEQGWGLIQLPPAELEEAAADAWRANALDQVAELRRHGVAVVVAVGRADVRERAALRHAGLDVPDAPADDDPGALLRALAAVAQGAGRRDGG